ncbi:MAG: deoxyribose-phosphate aldolase [Micrococcales bacterium]
MTKTYRGYTFEQVAKTIDHSILKPDFLTADIEAGCALALKYDVATVCIRPMDVALTAKLLSGSNVLVATVIGFPHGTTTTATKVFESVDAIRNGAVELDMVLNISALLSGDYQLVEDDIRAVVDAAHAELPNVSIKVIFETAYLTPELIVKACELTEAAGADYVKTSTGFASAGATLENVKLMKATVGDRLKVKSSGGVKTLDQLIDYMDAGVSRSGCSATEQVLEEFLAKAS